MERVLHAVVQNSGKDHSRFRYDWIELVVEQEVGYVVRLSTFETLKLQRVEAEGRRVVRQRVAWEELLSLVMDWLVILEHRQSRHLHQHLNLGHATLGRLCALQTTRYRCHSPHRTL